MAAVENEVEGQVAEAYRVCRAIARREAKNFYYSFVALPQAKRDAICAVYAFMRHADDLSDDESLPLAERRARLDAWYAAWQKAACDGESRDPVFLALRDAQRRFKIPLELLEKLVEGTTMDLRRGERPFKRGAASLDTYATFADLYRYCYLVASVVGLVCIRIFGYRDAQAEKLAEETGIAFQLTNILRDVREDAERGRVYLPVEDLQPAGLSPEQVAAIREGKEGAGALRKVLSLEARRAESYYESGRRLLPLIAADSRPALWVLIEIYHRLLRRIEGRDYDVFSERVRVPTWEKLAILGLGIGQVGWNRLLRRA
jgi:phytoene synthase